MNGERQSALNNYQLVMVGLGMIMSFASINVHILLPIPPSAISLSLGSLLLIIWSVKTRAIPGSQLMILPALCILYYPTIQIFTQSPIRYGIGISAGIAYFVIIASYGTQLKLEHFHRFISWFIYLSAIFLIAECVWRLYNVDYKYAWYARHGTLSHIYQYKLGGKLMYEDSNGVAIHLIVLIFFVLYYQSKVKKRFAVLIGVMFVLLILTFSRAGWVAGMGGLVYYLMYSRFSTRSFLTFFTSFAVVGLLFINYMFRNDLSFQSKFTMLERVESYVQHAKWNEILFGVGIMKSTEILGTYAHNFFLVQLVESGFIGLIITTAMFVQFIVASRKMTIVIIPFLVATATSNLNYLSFFYSSIAIIYLLEGKEANWTERFVYEG